MEGSTFQKVHGRFHVTLRRRASIVGAVAFLKTFLTSGTRRQAEVGLEFIGPSHRVIESSSGRGCCTMMFVFMFVFMLGCVDFGFVVF